MTEEAGDCLLMGEPLGTEGQAMALASAIILAFALFAEADIASSSLPELWFEEEPREPRKDRSSSEDLWLGRTTRRIFSGRSSP